MTDETTAVLVHLEGHVNTYYDSTGEDDMGMAVMHLARTIDAQEKEIERLAEASRNEKEFAQFANEKYARERVINEHLQAENLRLRAAIETLRIWPMPNMWSTVILAHNAEVEAVRAAAELYEKGK